MNGQYVAFSLGGNIGNPHQTLHDAIRLLGKYVFNGECLTSSFYETEPVGYAQQPSFVNAAVVGCTSMTPLQCLRLAKSIELRLGRQTRQRWHEREIDLDVVLYGDLILELPDIAVPHPRMHERRFVLEPLNEIAPNLIHPIYKKTVQQLYDELSDCHTVRKLSSFDDNT